MNLILSSGAHPGSSFDFNEMLVDWVKVEQRTPAVLNGDEYVCWGNNGNDLYEFTVDGIPSSDILEWTVSPNLEIIVEQGNLVGVRPISNYSTGEGWVEAHVSYENSCYGQRLRKNVSVGLSTQPIVKSFIKECEKVTLTITNFDPNLTYSWQVISGNSGPPWVYGNGKMIEIPVSEERGI